MSLTEFFQGLEKDKKFTLVHALKMEDIKIAVFRVTPNTESVEDDNLRFVEFQRFIEIKNTTKFLRYKLQRDFAVCTYNHQPVIGEKINKLTTAEEKIVNYLVLEKIQLSIHGELKTIEDIHKENHESFDSTWDKYLDNNIGSLTISQISHLYCEHDWVNIAHRELYGVLEYETASNGR
jgi:hypothetical protein